MDRAELIEKVTASHTRLLEAMDRFEDAEKTEPNLPDGWSIKDLLGHIGWWERRAVVVYQSVSGTGPSVDPIQGDQVDSTNAMVLDQFRGSELEQVRAFEAAAYTDLLRIVETAPENDLFADDRFPDLGGSPYLEVVLANTYPHYDEHLAVLEKVLAEREGSLPPVRAVVETSDPTPNPTVRRAGEFLAARGRDIDKALFDYHFGSGTQNAVIEALAKYQNPDGGFFGLEVDIEAPQSNPFATEIALVMMRWSHIPTDHPLVQRTVEYLERTQEESGVWRFAPEIYNYELAPWFQHWQWPNLNPSTTIAGLLRQLGLGSQELHGRVRNLFEQIANPEDLTGPEYYNVRPYAYYFQTDIEHPLTAFYRWGVIWWMVRQHYTNKELDAVHLMDFAPVPESEVAKRLPAAMLRSTLDALLQQQADDGGWPTPYNERWRPWVTITSLLVLRAHNWL